MTGKQKRADEINAAMAKPGFWDNQEQAQQLMDELRRLTLTVKPLAELVSSVEDMETLIELAEEDETGETVAELASMTGALENTLSRIELQSLMSRPDDGCNAYVAIQAGEGGSDSADWAETLLRMYLRWAEQRGFKAEFLDRSDAEEAGIRNATVVIRGDYVYGYLSGETGNHRLIRISPFDSAGRRHTSFAAVDVTPELSDDFEIDVDFGQDVREDTYRASGAGGQHVNKTDSAIRLTHLPTGVVVQCQNERSQHKNRALARKMLGAKLRQIEQDKRDAELAARRGLKSKIGFGGETIRNYVLHPEQYIKDTRTGLKFGNTAAVLDGEIDRFLEAYLQWSVNKG